MLIELKYDIKDSVCKFTDGKTQLCDITIIPKERTTECEQPFSVEMNFHENENFIGNWEFEKPIFYCEPNKTGKFGEHRINMKATNRSNSKKEDFYVFVPKENFTEENCLNLIAKMIFEISSCNNIEEFDKKKEDKKLPCMNRVKQII